MMKAKEIEEELHEIKEEISKIASKENIEYKGDMSPMLKYIVEEREKTNRILAQLTEKVNTLESIIESISEEPEEEKTSEGFKLEKSEEVALSDVDAKIINFAQTKGMVCADDIKQYMQYRGRNAACARLNKLYKQGLLDRFQLGHKVYYRFDAGKTTKMLIVSPPQ